MILNHKFCSYTVLQRPVANSANYSTHWPRSATIVTRIAQFPVNCRLLSRYRYCIDLVSSHRNSLTQKDFTISSFNQITPSTPCDCGRRLKPRLSAPTGTWPCSSKSYRTMSINVWIKSKCCVCPIWCQLTFSKFKSRFAWHYVPNWYPKSKSILENWRYGNTSNTYNTYGLCWFDWFILKEK